MFLRDFGDTEVGGFGISAEDDLLLVEDVRLIGQRTTVASVEFDDESVADFVDEQVDAGLPMQRFFRLWLHTHPGDSAEPSSVDEETFERVFGRCDWAVMAILAQGGESYARLRYGIGPAGEFEIPVCVDYARPFPAADPASWEREYDKCVKPAVVWHESARFADDPLGRLADLEFESVFSDDFGRIDEYDEYGSLFAAAGDCAPRDTEESDGDGDRRGGCRETSRVAAGGTWCAETATD